MTRSSLTEETPSTPGWVEGRVREIFAQFGGQFASERETYVNCLAGVGGATDMDAGHDRCRRALMDAIREDLDDPEQLERTLEELEAAISADT